MPREVNKGEVPVKRPVVVTLVALTTAAALLLPQLVAGAHDSTTEPRINIGKAPNGAVEPGDRVVISGEINGKKFCRRSRVVTLLEVTPGSDRRIDTDQSDREGEFRFVLRPNDDMTVYAKIRRLVDRNYNHRHVCRKARSENQDINVSG